MTKIILAVAAVAGLSACSTNPTVNPAEPVAPTAPARVAGKQFAVFFASGKSVITDEADETLRDLVALILESGSTRVCVAGHADTAESDADGVSKARADLVAQRLRALGVTAEIETRSAGAKELQVQTPANTKESQNRRVVIDY